jgi:hypothetical protein
MFTGTVCDYVHGTSARAMIKVHATASTAAIGVSRLDHI